MSKKAARESAAARAASVRAEAAAAERRRRTLTISVVVGVVLAIVLGGVLIQALRDTTGESTAAPSATASAVTGGAAVAAADTYGLGVGDPSAAVKVEIFEDFLCPYCREFEAASTEQLRQAAADGEAFVVYRPIAFLSEYSTRALNAFAVVLEEAGPEAALAFHDRLFEMQPAEGGEMPDDDWLIEQAVASGADEDAVRPGIEELAFEQWITNGADDASKRQVNSTPSVFADGELLSGASSIDDLVTQTMDAVDAGQ